jgi:DNA-binding GntR family transcriptional regulator
MVDASIDPPRRRAGNDAIFNTLRDRICLLVYPPGTFLSEAELAAEFGVSRTPIRTALHRLAFGGLIESRDGVGTFVTAPSFEELRDIYDIRLKIAEMIGELSPNPCTKAQIETAARLHARAVGLLQSFDILEYWQINHEMHSLIGDLIGNAPLREMWDHYYYQAARYWYAIARDMGQEVSIALVDEVTDVRRAMEAHDLIAVGYVQRNYIAFGRRKIVEQFKTRQGRLSAAQ